MFPDAKEMIHQETVGQGWQGIYVGGVIPLGYKIDRERHYQVDDKTLPFVEYLFSEYSNGKSLDQILKHWHNQEIRSIRGIKLDEKLLKTMLQDKRYLGFFIYDTIQIPHSVPQLISEELFFKASQFINPSKTDVYREEKALPFSHSLCKESSLHIDQTSFDNWLMEECRRALTPQVQTTISDFIFSQCNPPETKTQINKLEKEIGQLDLTVQNLIKVLEHGQDADLLLNRMKSCRTKQKHLEKQLSEEKYLSKDFTSSEIHTVLHALTEKPTWTLPERNLVELLLIEALDFENNKIYLTFQWDLGKVFFENTKI